MPRWLASCQMSKANFSVRQCVTESKSKFLIMIFGSQESRMPLLKNERMFASRIQPLCPDYLPVSLHWPAEFRFLMLSISLCRIWTYESKTCTGLQSRKLAEAIFTFFNVEVSRKCVLQDFGILCFTFHMCIIQRYRIYRHTSLYTM